MDIYGSRHGKQIGRTVFYSLSSESIMRGFSNIGTGKRWENIFKRTVLWWGRDDYSKRGCVKKERHKLSRKIGSGCAGS
nr:MAG TPA: hypothetical protein [Caudoviricetes sp.]